MRFSEFSQLMAMTLFISLGLAACGNLEKELTMQQSVEPQEDNEVFARGPMVNGGSEQEKEALKLYDEAEGVFIKDGNAERALPLYKKALAIDGGKSLYSSRLADALMNRHLLAKAKNVYLDSYKNDSFDSLNLVKLAEIAVTHKKFEEAYKYYLMALAVKSDSKEGWRGLIDVSTKRGNHPLVVRIDDIGMKREGPAGLALVTELIEDELKLHPGSEDLDYLVSLANCEISAFQFEKANQVLDKAMALKGDDPRVLLLKGQQLQYRSRVTEARAMLKRCIEISPFQACAWAALGNLEWKEKNISEALKCLERACNIDTSHPDWAARLAAVVKERDQKDLKKS